jgi:hypothetical protein
LFVHQFGTHEQKQELSSTLLGISANVIKDVFNKEANVLPCIYFVTLNNVKMLRDEMKIDEKYKDNDMVCKFGCAENFGRRIGELQTKFSEYIELYGIGSISYKNKFEIVRNGDVIDNIFVKLVLNESMIYRPSLGIKNVSLIIGGVTHYTCSGKYLEFINHCKKSDVHYLKIPAFHGKNSSLPSFALQYHCVELFIEFNNLDNIKDVALNVRYIYLNDIPRRKISQNLNLILINNPVDVDKENIDNKSIKFDIDVRSNIRDLYLICDNVSSVSFYCDDIIIWKHSNFLLNTIIPKNLLNTKLPFNHYYYSFSANGDMKCLEGYYKLVDKKNCYIIVELNSNVKVKAWLLYHQVYNCSICEGVGSISQVE